jgi:osmotically inducible lipoprotein OsmB
MKNTMLVTAIAMLALSACGTTPGDRAVSGGLIGAGGGAAIGSLSGNAGAGAVIGGVAGAATGALTDPCALNLGQRPARCR